jgi:hypothetical protein
MWQQLCISVTHCIGDAAVMALLLMGAAVVRLL